MMGLSIRTIYGTTGSDYLDWTAGTNYTDLYSLAYHSNGGNDTVSGGRFDDIFFLNSGAETIDGRGGNDTVSYIDSTAAVRVDLRNQVQHGGWAEGDRLTSIENVTGSQYGDTLWGNDQNNVIYGLDGNDAISGGRGNDKLYGGAGHDTFKDLASGVDVISGGLDKDTFRFDVGTDSFDITITDFNPLLWDDRGSASAPTESFILGQSIWELLSLNFRPESGITTQEAANNAVTYTRVGPTDHDAVVYVDTPNTRGTITFQGLGDALHNADKVFGGEHAFTIYQHYSLL